VNRQVRAVVAGLVPIEELLPPGIDPLVWRAAPRLRIAGQKPSSFVKISDFETDDPRNRLGGARRLSDCKTTDQPSAIYDSGYRLVAVPALFPAKAAATEATSSSGIPIRALAPLFGMTPRAMRSAIGAGIFPIPTYLARDRRYADRQVVTDYFSVKHAEVWRRSPMDNCLGDRSRTLSAVNFFRRRA
jgi:hypothetical protein